MRISRSAVGSTHIGRCDVGRWRVRSCATMRFLDSLEDKPLELREVTDPAVNAVDA